MMIRGVFLDPLRYLGDVLDTVVARRLAFELSSTPDSVAPAVESRPLALRLQHGGDGSQQRADGHGYRGRELCPARETESDRS